MVNTRTEAFAPITVLDGVFETRTFSYLERCVWLRLEHDFWPALEDIAAREQMNLVELIWALVEQSALVPDTPLASVARSFAIAYIRQSATEYGHRRAGHGPTKQRPQLTVVRGGG